MKHFPTNEVPGLSRSIALTAALLALGACNMNSQTNQAEGIGFREARFQEISAMREYRACRDEALELDSQARVSGSPGRHLASARLFEKCEADLGPAAAGVAVDERMRAYTLGILNYLKGGDIEKARENFMRFKEAYPSNDLYFVDGSSFVETMEVLLGRKGPWDIGRVAALNVNDALKDEIRRVRYWKRK